MRDLTKSIFLLLVFILVFGPVLSCNKDEAPTKDDDPTIDEETASDLIFDIDSASYNLGIPIYSASQGKEFWTEFNTQIRYFFDGDAKSNFRLKYAKNNPYLECSAEGGVGAFGLKMTLFKTFFDNQVLPSEIAERVTGIRFNAFGNSDADLLVSIYDVNGNLIVEKSFDLETNKYNSYQLAFDNLEAKEVTFSAKSNGESECELFGLDDVYLMTNDSEAFSPPESDTEFLTWLSRASYNFFEWNYVAFSSDRGVVLESYSDSDKVSLSGIGYSYPVFIIAAEEGYITQAEAKVRIKSMLNWQLDQNWFDGSGGWNGFPHHYFKKDGSNFLPDVSTIDWAICAAGIRVVKQYYADDQGIVEMAETLLARPDWSIALAEGDKIVMGFDGQTGEINDYRWALAYSEETELVYLEAVASGDLDASIFNAIEREKKEGFYPSWFGAGFTYNWLQLWTGPLEPYKSNSTAAFEVDAVTSQNVFDKPLMGLTACSTIKEVTPNGFMNWSKYISNQGGSVHGSQGGVIQISPAPYGAALALPFTQDKAILALREFTKMGFYHEYLGLPDNVRMNDLEDSSTPLPNWDPYDINIAPMILSIEQTRGNKIGMLYMSDSNINEAFQKLVQSFE